MKQLYLIPQIIPVNYQESAVGCNSQSGSCLRSSHNSNGQDARGTPWRDPTQPHSLFVTTYFAIKHHSDSDINNTAAK